MSPAVTLELAVGELRVRVSAGCEHTSGAEVLHSAFGQRWAQVASRKVVIDGLLRLVQPLGEERLAGRERRAGDCHMAAGMGEQGLLF